MTHDEILIGHAKALQAQKGVHATTKTGLRLCVADVEDARAKLADQKNLLVAAVAAIERVLETGQRITGHEMRDERYSKVTTVCVSIGFRERLAALEKEIGRAEQEISDWRAMWKKVHAEAKERAA